MRTASTIAIAAGAFLAGMGLVALAFGPLNPPAGPVAPSNKTLQEIEPRIAINATNTPGDADSLFKITQPGSYYLTGNITGVVGKHGVEIVASGVTLDLNGFDVLGVAGSLDGISVTVAGLTNIAAGSGSVRSWSGDGVDLTASANNCRVEGVLAAGNGGNGIRVGNNATVTGCSATTNAFSGMNVGGGCTLTNCAASGNAGDGFLMGNACTITGSASNSNAFSGINAGAGCTIVACSVFQNDAHGIVTSSTGTISDCSAQANSLQGINAGTGSTIIACSALGNGASGINTTSGCTIADCTARTNVLDGIVCTSSCLIRGNACAFNGSSGDGAGIHTTSTDNRIEGNNCTNADRGIDVDVAGNIIIRNTCSGNTTNWDIVANNIVGPILDRTAPASAAILGNTAPSSLGSTDPNANFTY